MTLSIILATRGRPQLLQWTLNTTLANIGDANTRLVVAIDEDDWATGDALAQQPMDPRVILSTLPREDSLGAKYNRVMSVAPADVYLVMVDYAPHVTPGFDRKILDAAALFPDGIGAVFNHLANLSFPQINAVTAKLVDKMGFLYPPYFPYWFIDHWLDDIARMIGRFVFADVVLDCRRRPGTQEMREPAFWATFYDAMIPLRRRCARDIIMAGDFQSPPWLKEVLLQCPPLVEERSAILNESVRAMGSVGSPADDRYRRIKAQAEAMMRDRASPSLKNVA